MKQFTPAQKRAVFALGRHYITQLALISTRRQQLQQQLLNSPAARGLSKDEMLNSHMKLDAITQQLQECAALQHKLFIQYTIAVAHGVSSCLPLIMASLRCIVALSVCSGRSY